MVVAIIGGLCAWGIRCKKKAEEEKYQVHKVTFYFLWIKSNLVTKVNLSGVLKKDRNPDFNTGRFWARQYPEHHSCAADRSMNSTTLVGNANAIPPEASTLIYDYCFCKMLLLLFGSFVGTKVRPFKLPKKGQKTRIQYMEIQGFYHIYNFTSGPNGIWCTERFG